MFLLLPLPVVVDARQLLAGLLEFDGDRRELTAEVFNFLLGRDRALQLDAGGAEVAILLLHRHESAVVHGVLGILGEHLAELRGLALEAVAFRVPGASVRVG